MIKRVPPPVKKAGPSSSLNKIKPPTSRIQPAKKPMEIQLVLAVEQPEEKVQNPIQNDQSNQQIESNSVNKEQQSSEQVQTVNAKVTQGLSAENTPVAEKAQTKGNENNKQSQENTKQEDTNQSEYVQIKVLPNIPRKLPPQTAKRIPGNVPGKVLRPQTKPPKPGFSLKIQEQQQKAQIKEETVETLKQTKEQVARQITPKIQSLKENIQSEKEVVQMIEDVKPDTQEIPENQQQVDIKDDQPQTKPIQVKPPPPVKKSPSQNRIPPPVKKAGPFQPPKVSLTIQSIAEEKTQIISPKQQGPNQISKISGIESGISEKSSNIVQAQESVFEESTDKNFTPTSQFQRQNSVQNANENAKQSLENQTTVALSRTASVPVAPVTKIPSPKKLPNLPRQNPPHVPKKQFPTPVPQPEPPKIQVPKVPSPPQPITQLPSVPSQPTQTPSTQYSELQQKLRKLQLLRSRIDESSQESYSNHDNIEEEESEVSLDRSNEKLGSEINVIDQRTITEEGQQHEVNDFRIGQTNYEEMQIKDHQQQQIQPIQQVQSDQIQVINETSLQPLSLSPQNRPLQSIYSSNIATEQTKHQYLPDEVSNSQQSQGSMARHHHIVVGLKNNVEHVDKYRSEMDFDSLTPEGNVVHGFDQIRESDLYEDRSDGDLGKVEKERDEITEHKHKMKDSSVQTLQDKGSGSNEIADQLKPQITKSSQKTLQQASNTAIAIQSLLSEFASKKSQYLQNLQNLKQIQKRCTEQQHIHKERILKILQQVNHKNAMILKHANGSSVKSDKQNSFLEGKIIGNILSQGDEL